MQYTAAGYAPPTAWCCPLLVCPSCRRQGQRWPWWQRQVGCWWRHNSEGHAAAAACELRGCSIAPGLASQYTVFATRQGSGWVVAAELCVQQQHFSDRQFKGRLRTAPGQLSAGTAAAAALPATASPSFFTPPFTVPSPRLLRTPQQLLLNRQLRTVAQPNPSLPLKSKASRSCLSNVHCPCRSLQHMRG